MKKTVILYHAESNCPDGFGAAYAAWKKFGDDATYVPLSRGDVPPYEAVEGADAYFLDFCYPQEIMDEFVKRADSLTMLDHHQGIENVIRTMPTFVFDANRSGAGIAWDYFHPGVPRPKLIDYIEDDDIYRFALPDTRAFLTYIMTTFPFSFTQWDEIARKLDDEKEREGVLHTARSYLEYFYKLAEMSIEKAKLVSFEGYEVYFANVHPLKNLKSYVGNELAKKHPPFALVVSAHPLGYGVSIRSAGGGVDVAKIAQKYGGNGHRESAGFSVPADKPLPWKMIETDEDYRD